MNVSLSSRGGRTGHKEKQIIYEQVVENMLLMNSFWCLDVCF